MTTIPSRRPTRFEILEQRLLLAADAAPTFNSLNDPASVGEPVAAEVALVSSTISSTNDANPAVAESATPVAGEIDLPAFADRLRSVGVQLFGATWCSQCTAQRELFADGAAQLPYIELANPDGTPNLIAVTSGIQRTPTWRIPMDEDADLQGIVDEIGIPADLVVIGNGSLEIQTLLTPAQLQHLTGLTAPLRAAASSPTLDAQAVDALFSEETSSEETLTDEKDVKFLPLPTAPDLQSPAVNLLEFARSLRLAGVRFYGSSGEIFTRAQTDLFGAAASELPLIEAIDRDGAATPEASLAGITSRPTWQFPGTLDRDAAATLFERLGLGFHDDQWIQRAGSFEYLGILYPEQLAAVTGLEMPMTTLRGVIEMTTAPQLVTLADTLTDRGVQFFGAHWCGVCQAQKGEFQRAADLLPYVEVTHPDGSPNDIAFQENITAYPTWRFLGEFADVEHAYALATEKLGDRYDPSRIVQRGDGFDIVGILQPSQLSALVGLVDAAPQLRAEGEQTVNPYQNPRNTFDVNDDGQVTPLDALIIINELHRGGSRVLPPPSPDTPQIAFVDVTGDGSISPWMPSAFSTT